MNELRAENERLRAQLAKAQDAILSLRNERAAVNQWFNWLRGHLKAGELFNSPDYVAEVVWKNPPKSWREGGEGGVVRHPETTKERTAGSDSALWLSR